MTFPPAGCRDARDMAPSPQATAMPLLSARTTVPGTAEAVANVTAVAAAAGAAASSPPAGQRLALRILRHEPFRKQYAPGSGLYAFMRRRMSAAGREKSSLASSFETFLQYVAFSSFCRRSCVSPFSMYSRASTAASALSRESFAESSPHVSSPMRMRFTSNMSPVSRPSSVFMTVTPVYSKPSRMADCMGDAPRRSGSRDACRFHTPCGKRSRSSLESIWPYAQVIIRSAPMAATSATCVRILGRSKTCMPCDKAYAFTGVGVRAFLRPTGLSGCVITAATSLPDCTIASSAGTAYSGDPAYIIFMLAPPFLAPVRRFAAGSQPGHGRFAAFVAA